MTRWGKLFWSAAADKLALSNTHTHTSSFCSQHWGETIAGPYGFLCPASPDSRILTEIIFKNEHNILWVPHTQCRHRSAQLGSLCPGHSLSMALSPVHGHAPALADVTPWKPHWEPSPWLLGTLRRKAISNCDQQRPHTGLRGLRGSMDVASPFWAVLLWAVWA